jgi:hypothetical protein
MAGRQGSPQARLAARGRRWGRRLDLALTSAAILWLAARFVVFAWRRSA